MKRGRSFLAVAMVIVAGFGTIPAHADPPVTIETGPHAGCTPVQDGTLDGFKNGFASGHGYVYCGYHWATLPAKFHVVSTGAPPGFRHVVQSAAAEWNRWWPRPGLACGAIVCDGTNDSTVANTIKFGPLPAGILGQTTVTSSGLTIIRVDIVVNDAVSWRTAGGSDLFTGEEAGVAASACAGPTCKSWYDLQDLLTHELGHFVGLEDVGDQSACLADISESLDFSETMYGCFWPGDTSKRTLSWGDVAGLMRLAQDY